LSKILPRADLPSWRAAIRDAGLKLVATNGCFDVLHAGHVTYLSAARAQGDRLIVGLNSDASVRALKGPDRPVNPEDDRALVLEALSCVDAVTVFEETRATEFLEAVQPDLYVKGGDLTVDQIPIEERRAVEAGGGRILIMPHVAGRSTTAILDRMRRH